MEELRGGYLNHLVSLDPLLLPLIVTVCPASGLPEIFSLIPPFVSSSRLRNFITPRNDNFKTLQTQEVSAVAHNDQ